MLAERKERKPAQKVTGFSMNGGFLRMTTFATCLPPPPAACVSPILPTSYRTSASRATPWMTVVVLSCYSIRMVTISEHVFSDLPDLLPSGSLLVGNQTRVIHARLQFTLETGKPLEIFCLEPLEADGLRSVTR